MDVIRNCTNFEVQWGLFAYPQEVLEFQAMLRLLQWDDVPQVFLHEDVHLFTDGSTVCPETPCLSLSSWGVVLALPGVLGGTGVVSGVVPGEQQTNNRAELLAVIAAVLSGTGVIFILIRKSQWQGFANCSRGGGPFRRGTSTQI